MLKGKKSLKKNQILFLILLAILLIIVIVTVKNLIKNKKEEEVLKEKTYSSLEDFQTMKDVAKYSQAEYIKEENSLNKEFNTDVYVKFKYNLFEEDVSKQEYYESFIKLSARVLNYKSFRLIDEDKKILIEVTCDETSRTVKKIVINGDENYFGNTESEKSLETYEEMKLTKLNIQAKEVTALMNNEWIAKNVDFGTQDSSFENYAIYFDEGMQIKTAGKKVFNIIFTNKYTNSIVNNIKVGTDLGKIKEVLGTPTFEDGDECFGYKGEDIYVFFLENAISVYRVEKDYDITEVLKIIEAFNENKETNRYKRLATALTDIWDDYDLYEYDKNYINLKYTLKGLDLKVNIENNNGITLYNNCNKNLIQSLSQKNVDNSVFYNLEEDGIFNDVKYLKNKLTEYKYYALLSQDEELIEYNTKTSTKFSIYTISDEDGTKKIKILSLSDENPNSEINKKIKNYLWLDDDNLVYSIENEGIYIYNAVNVISKLLIEGEEKFDLKEINSENILIYDDKEIQINL